MTPLRRLLHYFELHKTALILGGLCVLGSACFSLLKPLIVGNAVDELSKALTRGALVRYGLMFVAASAIEGIFLYAQRWIIIGASRHIEFEMRNDFYAHLQKLPVSYYQDQRTGDLMSRATNDLSSVRMLIGPAVMHSVSSLIVVTGAFIMMLRIDRMMALTALASVPVIIIMVKFFGQRIHVKFKAVQDYFGDISARVQENLAGVRVVRAFTQEPNEIATFKMMNRQYVERNRTLIRLTATFYPALHALIGFMFVFIFYLGSRRILSHVMTIGSFVAFQFYLGRMIWPLIALGWVINLFQRGMASMQRLHEVWSVEPGVLPDDGTPIEGEIRGDIDIRDLTFSYPTSTQPVLKNINMQVRAGETIGIVGRTGSGKSTLLALITRTFDPPAGTVFLDGTPIETMPLRQLRGLTGMVPQETFLFSESLAENIRFGRGDATDADVDEAARLAGLSTDVAGFPQGLHTVIGERGITLSGGQKQRTALARAVLRDPRVLVLDDALSSVDTETEERILRRLADVMRQRTTILISHRCSTVRHADQIVVLRDGQIVERGTHPQLLALGGYYYDLYQKQLLEEELERV